MVRVDQDFAPPDGQRSENRHQGCRTDGGDRCEKHCPNEGDYCTAWLARQIARRRSRRRHDAWLLVQHADRDRPFQKQCLELLREAVAKKEASGKDLADLTDRVLVGEGKNQIYGTQFITKDGKTTAQPMEDSPDNVELAVPKWGSAR